ncbi:MAG: HlyD family efflux transporter periplasmic adaptor subunit [Magnetococcales bacterium]|nr:HlyD family efflux transporter periplasmic adaptor subunit [Magnetococcales bacterium]
MENKAMPIVTLFLVMLGLVVFPTGLAWGHGGEDHGAGDHGAAKVIQQQGVSSGLGYGAQGDRFEGVVVPTEGPLTWLYLSDVASNAAVAQATVEVEATGNPGWTDTWKPTPVAGVYRLERLLSSQEAVTLTITVTHADGSDLLLIAVPSHNHPPATSPESPESKYQHLFTPVGVVFVVVFCMVMLLRRKKKLAMLVGLLLMATAGHLHAHGGEDHVAPSQQPSMIVPGSGREVALPKSSQFLLDVRTAAAASREVIQTIRLVGRVIADPAFHVRVHPQLPSRIGYDPLFPPPRSGQWIKRGQPLAVLDPLLSLGEKAGQRQSLLKGEQMESSVGREMVLAPIDGQMTDVHIVPGDVVTQNDVLAEIIDPAHLWIEAVLYDISVAERIIGGTAATRQIPGKHFPLVLMGISPKVNPENLGLHLQFALGDNTAPVKVGMPMDVYAHTGAELFGIAIPRVALLDQGGIPMVWVKTAPERFVSRPVALGRKTAEWVEVLQGIGPAEKVVVQGHNQLNAMR